MLPSRTPIPIVALCLAAGACTNLQRLPDPILLHDSGTADGAVRRSGTVATVLRHAGPVEVRPPGSPAGHPLTFDRKLERLESGARVRVGSAGRAEILRRGSPVSIVLFGPALAEMGDPARDEPLVWLHGAASAALLLDADQRVGLPGGALLRWSAPVAGSSREGRVVLRAAANGVFRLENESSGLAIVDYRDATFEVGPGGVLDLPALAEGTAPFDVPPSDRSSSVDGSVFRVWGEVEESGGEGRVVVRGAGGGGVRGLGASVTLAPEDEATLEILGAGGGESTSSPQE
ncbi:MAG TPA: hypothetical protein ENJ09_13720 [Planctomycetes bacterium]|nr:hypothetical protein [Planctomycetota bacterium]